MASSSVMLGIEIILRCLHPEIDYLGVLVTCHFLEFVAFSFMLVMILMLMGKERGKR